LPCSDAGGVVDEDMGNVIAVVVAGVDEDDMGRGWVGWKRD
jgi:hypothetical protein